MHLETTDIFTFHWWMMELDEVAQPSNAALLILTKENPSHGAPV